MNHWCAGSVFARSFVRSFAESEVSPVSVDFTGLTCPSFFLSFLLRRFPLASCSSPTGEPRRLTWSALRKSFTIPFLLTFPLLLL